MTLRRWVVLLAGVLALGTIVPARLPAGAAGAEMVMYDRTPDAAGEFQAAAVELADRAGYR